MALNRGPGDNLNRRGGSMIPPGDPMLEAMRGNVRRPEPEPEEAAKPPTPPVKPAVEETPEPTEVATNPDTLATDTLRTAMHKQAAALRIEITDEDMMTFVFRSFVTKRVSIIPDLLEVELRTLTSEDMSDVNMRVSRDLEQHPEMINQEIRNRNALYMMQAALLALGQPGKLRKLPEDPVQRLEQLNKLAPAIINKIVQRFNIIEFLINERLEDKDLIKN